MGKQLANLIRFLCAAIFLLVAGLPASAAIVYVNSTATGGNNGSSWVDAYTDLQSALVPAVLGDSVWVAAGTYKPTTGSNRAATFQLKNSVWLYGGFAGTETTLAERDWVTNPTILSGDIGVPADSTDNSFHVVTGSGTDSTAVLDGLTVTAGEADGTGNDLNGGGMWNNTGSPTLVNLIFSRNYAGNGAGIYNFVNSNPTLVNVTFSNNYAAGNGAGVFNYASSPTLTDVVISENHANANGGGIENGVRSAPLMSGVVLSGNSATLYGGGLHNNKNSSAALNDVTFSGNHAKQGGGMWNSGSNPALTDVVFTENSAIYGGGMWNTDGNPTLTNVVFLENSAISRGGGMLNESNSSPTLTNVVFSGNHSDFDAAGMYNETSSPTLVNVIFSENYTLYQDGGGMYNRFGSDPALVNVLFRGNQAQHGGGMWNYASSPTLTNVTFWGNSAGANGGGMWNYASGPTLTNTILWGDYAGIGGHEIDNISSSPVLSYSLVLASGGSGEGWDVSLGTDGGHNIDADPLFANAPDGDLRLGSAYSPAVNAGNNSALPPGVATDLDGNLRIVGDTVDMGAYEFQEVTGIEPASVPRPFRIVSVSPNPFNPSTTVRFTLPTAMRVTAGVWSVTGARVRVLANKQQFGPGNNRLVWDGRNDHGSLVASGVYFVRIETRLGTTVTRAVLLK